MERKKTPSEPGTTLTKGNHADCGLKGTARSNDAAGRRAARARATARGTHHARVGLSLAFRGVVFPRRRRVGSRRVRDRGRHGDLRWHGRLSGVCEPRRRGPGVSRLESRWNATSREDGAASRERPGESPCGSRAARGDLPARERVKRASTEVEIIPRSRDRQRVDKKKILTYFRFGRLFSLENIVEIDSYEGTVMFFRFVTRHSTFSTFLNIQD